MIKKFEGDLNSFDARFGNMLDESIPESKPSRKMPKMSVRNINKAKAKAMVIENDVLATEYDNEEDYGDEYGDEFLIQGYSAFDIQSIMLLSQQPFEIHDIVLHPDNIDMVEFLEKDELYNWKYINPSIKKQTRSLSMDMAKPFEE